MVAILVVIGCTIWFGVQPLLQVSPPNSISCNHFVNSHSGTSTPLIFLRYQLNKHCAYKCEDRKSYCCTWFITIILAFYTPTQVHDHHHDHHDHPELSHEILWFCPTSVGSCYSQTSGPRHAARGLGKTACLEQVHAYYLFTLRKPRSPLIVNGEWGFLRMNRLVKVNSLHDYLQPSTCQEVR